MLLKVPHLVQIETDRMYYLRALKAYHEQECRPPVIVHHDPLPVAPDDTAPAAAAAALALPPTNMRPSFTRFARQQLEEHVLGVGLLPTGSQAQPTQQQRMRMAPRKYFQELKRQRRAKLLTERGLFGSDATRAHQAALQPRAYAKRTGIRN